MAFQYILDHCLTNNVVYFMIHLTYIRSPWRYGKCSVQLLGKPQSTQKVGSLVSKSSYNNMCTVLDTPSTGDTSWLRRRATIMQDLPIQDSREHSRGHPTRSSGYYSLAHTQPVKSSPCASYQKGAYGQLAAYTVRMRTAGRSLVACLHFLPLFHCLQYR